MTPNQLAEIEARAEAATPGPWGIYGYIGVLQTDGKRRNIIDIGFLGTDERGFEISVRVEETGIKPKDADFIAHARTDIPALLAHIRELEAERTNERR